MRVKADKIHQDRARRPAARQPGQAMVEMAMVLPLFLLLLFGIIEIGRAWAARQALTNAAREGARILVLPYGTGFTYQTADEVRTAAVDKARSYLSMGGIPNPDGAQIDVKHFDLNGDPTENAEMRRGEKVGLLISYSFDTPLPVLLLSWSNPIPIRVSSIMEHE